ncbi:MAG: phenylalanine--tRNA ligase subunit beta [Clostridia bacterium]|nr:phenylalanine--tRNA ligase subunit beta [Clostridia bacterium]
MKLSRKFVEDYIDLDKDLEIKDIAEAMTNVGSEYDSAEKMINATKLVIGEIKECEEHPDSDHLHVCKVDVGTEVLQIVCGAPNARKGIKVIVAREGADLPGGIKIKRGQIRGVESCGMMCSIAELGLDSKFLTDADKEGIAELGEDAIVGEDPVKYLEMDDEVVDFELTANRGDLLSILGMAYELGAIYNKKVKDIDLSYTEAGEDINKSFEVDVQTKENCKLFLAKKVTNVTVKESPKFIKNRLMACGIRPINNVVDISNYVMLEVGQPLHFYDADRLGNKIVVRMAENEEKLTTLDNIERTLNTNDIVIADAQKPIGLAGVMGGLTTEVEDDTKNIVIEAAVFNSVKVRMTSNKILRSEASNRFEKGLDPNRTYMAVERACHLLEKYADAKIQTGLVVYDDINKEDKIIEIDYKFINDVLGSNISNEEINSVLGKLGFKVEEKGESAVVTVPTRRIDISIKEDLVEEVGRIYGVNNIQGKLPVVPMKKGSYDKTTREIRNKMISLGLNEVLSYILINDKEVHKYTLDEFEEVKLLDALTEDRNTLRYMMIPSLLKIYEYNKARNLKDISIFEIGKGFFKKNGEYGENNKLCALMTGEYFLGINNTKKVDFYVMKGIVEEILDYFGYGNRYSLVKKDEMPEEFHPGQTAYISVNNDIVGIVGKLHPEVQKDDVYVLEINLDKLLEKRVGKMKYKDISKFPGVSKDLAVVVDKKVIAKDIEAIIKKASSNLLSEIKVFDVYEGANLGENKKSIAFNLYFEAANRTLVDEEINKEMENVIKAVENKLGGEIRK